MAAAASSRIEPAIATLGNVMLREFDERLDTAP